MSPKRPMNNSAKGYIYIQSHCRPGGEFIITYRDGSFPFYGTQSVLVLCDIKLLVKGASININLCKEENQWCLINTLSSVNLCLNVLKCGFYWIQNSPNQKLWLEFWNSLFEQGNLRSCKSSLFTSFISGVTKMLGPYVIRQILSL